MIKRFLNSQAKTITFAAVLLSVSGLVSRFLGLIRDRLLAGEFGAGETLDVYFAAFRIPDFVYGILILGGIVAAFLPVFSEYFQKDKEKAFELTNNVLNCFLVLLVFLCGILVIFAPLVLKFVAPGFSPESKALAVALTRIMFLSPIFFGLSAIFSGVLHYFNRFLIYSLAPILYNLGIIFGILFLVPIFGIYGLAYGVVLGAIFHWLIQVPSVLDTGFRYRPHFNFRYPGLQKIFNLMIPRTIGQFSYHLNLIVITALASTLAAGSITIFNFSNNIHHVPVGLIGIPFALASFPVLSRAWASGRKKEFMENFSLTFCQILFLIIPISILMFLLRTQIVGIVLGTGQFDWQATKLTSACLGLFCLGIFAFSFIHFLSRTFFSLHDTKTPVKISIASIALNIVLCFFFLFLLRFENSFQYFVRNVFGLQGIEGIEIVGLPLALSIAGVFQFFLLLVFLERKIGSLFLKKIWPSFKKIFLATFLMGFFVYFVIGFSTSLFDLQTFWGMFFQTALAGILGLFVYLLLAFLLKSPEIGIIKSSILKQFSPD
ncbi:murein biosynthesis integral membrane protein MurJ [Patescibacteria group bacterium]